MLKKLITILVLAVLLPACDTRPKLVIYSQGDIFPPEIITGFENEKGIKIRHVVFNTNENMITRLKAARGGRYDLIIANNYIIENVINEGLAKKLDLTMLPNFSNINPIFQGFYYDPNNEYTIPYGANLHTIVYNPERINITISSYLDLWHPNLRQQLGFIDNFRVINGMALRVMGHSYNTNDLAVIQEAGNFLAMLVPNIRIIRNNGLEDSLISGEINVAVMNSVQARMAKIEKPELEVVFPAEGIGFEITTAFIPVRAPNVEAAYIFLEYILDPRRGALCFEFLGYYSTFSASNPYISESFRDIHIIPEDFIRHGFMEVIRSVSPEAEAVHTRVWSEFITPR